MAALGTKSEKEITRKKFLEMFKKWVQSKRAKETMEVKETIVQRIQKQCHGMDTQKEQENTATTKSLKSVIYYFNPLVLFWLKTKN